MPVDKNIQPATAIGADISDRSARSARFQWLLLLALIPHIALAIYLGHQLVSYPDQDAYLSAAHNMIAGRGLMISFDAFAGYVKKDEPTSFFGAGTPLLLAAQIWLFGENYFLLRLGNILLFALSLIFFRGICRFWMSERLAALATVFMALSPFYIIFNQLFLTETPFICCQLGAFFFLFRYLRSNAKKHLVWSAVLTGLNLLVRTNLLLFVPFIALAIAVKRHWRHALIYLAVITIVVSPYCIRNSINNRAFFPFDGKAAFNLWMFNSDVHTGGFWDETFLRAPKMPPLEGLTEKERADLLMGIALKWIRENPGAFTRLMAMKAVRFLSPLPKMAENRRFAWFLTPYALLMLIGFFIGVWHLFWKDPEHILVVLLFLYTLAIEMIFMPATRHRLLYDPFFILVTFRYLDTRGWLANSEALTSLLSDHRIPRKK
jgi:4-amino-4-deoxy-L-arabinose transferase-like glycosyltransferase